MVLKKDTTDDADDLERLMSTGRIPAVIADDESLAGGRGMTTCYVIGIMGYCGKKCPVLQAGQCEYQDEMESEK